MARLVTLRFEISFNDYDETVDTLICITSKIAA